MQMKNFSFRVLTSFFVLCAAAGAQDTRTVTEPAFPKVCTALPSQLAISNGDLTSETAFDTARIQTALNACPSGQAVELQVSGLDNAFLTQPISIPSGVTLILDGGVTLFASRNPADYQLSGKETCGTIGTKGGGCGPLISVNNGSASSGSGLMGYGVIDGRGNEPMIVGGVVGTASWWDTTTADSTSRTQNKPVLLNAASAANFTLYKVTFRNAPYFNVQWSGNGFTAWGVKTNAPGSSPNTDGIDPSGSNITITRASLSDGDDHIAVKAGNASSNITVSNTNTFSGHGISVGSQTNGGLTNMLVTDINQYGDGLIGGGIGLRLKSDAAAGGLVKNVTYQNICSTNVDFPIVIDPFYDSRAGTLIPTFQNITFRNFHSTTNGKYQFQGYDATHPTTLTLDNVILDGLTQSHITPDMQYLNITIGPGPVTTLLRSQTGTGVSYSGSITNTTQPAYACSMSNFQFLPAELYLSTPGTQNLQSATLSSPATFTLNAVLYTAKSQLTYVNYKGTSYAGVPAPTAGVAFYEGSTQVATASLGGNGTLAAATLSGVTPGTHTYIARYLGDSNYPSFTFGSVVVTIGLEKPAIALNTLPASPTYGTTTKLTATLTTTSTNPTGTVLFYEGATLLGTSTLVKGAASLDLSPAGGTHNITAVYAGDMNFATVTSAVLMLNVASAAASVSLAAAPDTVASSATSALTATVTGVPGGATPSGSIVFAESGQTLATVALDATGRGTYAYSSATLAAHHITATYSGDSNYGNAQSAVTVTVTTIPTTTSLAVQPTFAGSNLILTATVIGATGTPTGAVTFSSGSTTLGVGTLGKGQASINIAAGSARTMPVTASYGGDGVYTPSSSAAVSVTVAPAFTTAATPTTLTLAPGASGTVTLAATAASGFTGSINYTCATAINYVTCGVTPTATGAIAGINVLAAIPLTKTAQSSARSTLFFALAVCGALCLRRRRLPMLAALIRCAAFGIAGCADSKGVIEQANRPPAGTQAVTITATATVNSVATTQTTTITVNITN